MRWNARTWAILSVLLLTAAAVFWHLGERRRGAQPAAPVPASPAAVTANAAAAAAFPLLSRGDQPAGAKETEALRLARERHPHQLSNSRRHIGQLARSSSAILLQNALIETTEGTSLPIPDALRVAGDPGAFIIQSRQAPDVAFRRLITNAGAAIISYIPNNAYLVRAPRHVVDRLAASPSTRSVLPYEPYYKLDDQLLDHAVNGRDWPAGRWLNVTGFPGEREMARATIESLGGVVKLEEPTPFGPLFVVEPAPGNLLALAQSPAVQGLEVYGAPTLCNDFSRLALGIVTNSDAATPNLLGLSGSNITVNVNDSGADATHPDLIGRVLGTLFDFDGHGTHVSGTIASSGVNSPANTVSTNGSGSIPGSATNANFRGMAPAANLYVLPINLTAGSPAGNYFLHTNAAYHNYGTLSRTNPMVSNNSWGVPGAVTYNIGAAAFDAAVRDALPETPGMQPLIYVFAAGNEGFGNDNGTGGFSESVRSPGTAKNVITVGALENRRFITNEVTVTNFVPTNITFTTNIVGSNTIVVTNITGTNVVVTNVPFLAWTDSSNQIASFSSRGNIGIGVEGLYGRFKPDVVAPGVFTLSTRASTWSSNASRLPPLDAAVAPYYRYETGTSMAAPGITGMVALMQEFFEAQLGLGYSPALIKALLINSARSVNQTVPQYGYSINETVNYQGWGLPSLPNSLPTNGLTTSRIQFVDQSVSNALATGETRAFSLTLNSIAATNPVQPGTFPLRITLVWTDPAGNPNAAIKLVNDLDLVVSNTVTGELFAGNNFEPGAEFTVSSGTNAPVTDVVNNVENVFLEPPVGSNFVIYVTAKRVNVNAVTAHPDNTVQDFALVVSSDYLDPAGGPPTTPFTLAALPSLPAVTPPVKAIGNGAPLWRERVGANSPLIGTALGVTNQWAFYVFTNSPGAANSSGLTNGSNVAFLTFFPPNLSGSRHVPNTPLNPPVVGGRALGADVDLYVSTDPNLTNLNPFVLATALKSTNRGGNELVVLPPDTTGQVFYLGVKSEDQQAAEFSLIALSTDQPFARQDTNGNVILTGLPVPLEIPDGVPENPSYGNPAVLFGINPSFPLTVQRVVVTNTMTHELFGDLFCDLQHDNQFAVLFSHNRFSNVDSGTHTFVFDDSGRGDIPGALRTDSAAESSLNNFVGANGLGAWQMTFSDNALFHGGRVDSVDIFLERRPDTNALSRIITLCGGDSFLDAVDILPGTTNLTISINILSGSQLEIYVRRDNPATPALELPTLAVYDKRAVINSPGGSMSIGLGDVPPLRPGRYYVLIYNPTATCVDFTGPIYQIDRPVVPGTRFTFSDTNTPLTLTDDAIFRSTNVVSLDQEIYSVEVGLRIDHPRVSDLAVHLISPQGTRALLVENRGLQDTNGFGAGTLVTNVFPASYNGSFQPDTNIISAGVNAGTLVVQYNFYSIPDRMTIYYDNTNLIDTGFVNGLGRINVDFGPGLSTNITLIINEGTNQNPGTIWDYTAYVIGGISYLVFTDDTNRVAAPIKFTPPPFNNGTNAPLYVRPEESLDVFRGESSLGEWLLEIWDTRTGAAITNGLVSWDLRFIRADAPGAVQSATTLANCTPYSGTIAGNQIQYFIVDVPANATAASNILDVINGSGMILGAHRAGFPVASSPPDDYNPVTVTGSPGTGVLNMSDVGFPPLQPGQRYYLSVQNRLPNETNNFLLTACLTLTPPPTPAPIAALSNGTSTLDVTRATTALDYFRFNVASNTAFTVFELQSLDGNAELVLRQGTASQFPLPTRSVFDQAGVATGASNEVVVVPSPAGAAAGTWYLGVFTRDNRPVNYSVRATEYRLGTNAPFSLSNAVTVLSAVPGGYLTTNHYRFSIAPSDTAALFELFNPTGDADLFVARDGFPATPTFFSTGRGRLPEQIVIRPGQPGEDISGDYHLVVASRDTNPVSFNLRAAVADTNGMLRSAQPLVADLARPLVVTNAPLVEWNSVAGERYVIEVSTNLVSWQPYATNTPAGSRGRFADPNPPGTLNRRFYRVLQVAP